MPPLVGLIIILPLLVICGYVIPHGAISWWLAQGILLLAGLVLVGLMVRRLRDGSPQSAQPAADNTSLANQLTLMEERTRIANELHDSLAQTLASLKIQVRVLDETLHQGDEAVTWQELEKIEQSLDEANTELRELIGRFRAPIGNRGLVQEIASTVARFRRQTGIPIYLQNEWGSSTLDADSETQVLRIVQEALANVRKHSNASAVRIMLRQAPESHFRVLVEDDGVGFDETGAANKPGEHIGLSVMAERAQQLGGELRIETEPGEGTRVLLTFAQTATDAPRMHMT